MIMADADVVAVADADANVVADADADAASAGCGWEATTAGCWDGGLQGETSGRKGGCCLIREDDGHLLVQMDDGHIVKVDQKVRS